MPGFRFVLLVAVAVGVMTAVAISSSDRVTRNGQATTTAPLPEPVYQPTRSVEAKLPHDGPVKARLGDMIVLRWTPEDADVVELDAFGFQQGLAAGVPNVLRIVAARPGTFALMLRRAGKPLVELQVEPREPLSGGTEAQSSTE